MPRIVIPDSFEPSLQFRYRVTTSKLPGAQLYARSSQQPGTDGAPVTVEHINAYFKVKGKLRWTDVAMTFYQFEGVTAQEVWSYLQQHQEVNGAVDTYGPVYKHDLSIEILGPDGSTPTGTWSLKGAWFATINWGQMDWGIDDVIQCDVTVSYDWATYS